ncbi:protein of unknown function [Nitrospira japonica]|uniref:Uncharacterized protein n=2 Tax=Nitrospira japonica TaxID=1325564 RepID=A0A1W1I3A2_9BACT|nr:protein of unknown function [Nitrospira japonica]
MPTSLQTRLATVFSDDPQTRVMAGVANWRPGSFGTFMPDVRSVVVHVTGGFPPRERVEEFVKRYVGPPADWEKRDDPGIGTQYFVPGDGTVFGLINMPSITLHGNHTNNWAIGVETGNLSESSPPPGSRWASLAANADQNADDVPGAKLWISHRAFREVVVSWWTTRTYAGPAREALGDRRYMLFTEQQYRGWALLARFLCERHDLPRNFPLLPHARRERTVDNSATFRRLALADERFPVLVRALAAHHIHEALFESANAATLEARYDAAIQPRNMATNTREHNRVWTALFDVYRGFHGHGFSGSNTLNSSDHDCPGPLFDWHRFAREVWDWWWYPFDLSDDLVTVVTARRPERRADGTTPLREYYFESTRDFDAKDRAYTLLAAGSGLRSSNGIFGDISSPSTFNLGTAGVPIYAPANGELVAARFPNTGDEVSMAFVLVRHEIFHLPDTLSVEIEGVGSFPANPGRIDYDQEPTYVYSLIIHLARPDGMSFTEVTDSNPCWLNRVLIRKKECDLVLALYDASAAHGGIEQAAWDSRPPGTPRRPTVLESWRTDAVALLFFLERLRAGDVAVGASGRNNETPIRVLLGDFLGHAGVIRKEGTMVLHGIGLETFGSGFVPPAFQSVASASGWSLPAGTPMPMLPAVFYQSEWSKAPSAEERTRLQGIGVNPDLVNWWGDASLVTRLHPTLPGHGQLNAAGFAFHYEPLKFMRWLNETTWASEWPKYKVTDAAGAAVPQLPDHPRPRARNV